MKLNYILILDDVFLTCLANYFHRFYIFLKYRIQCWKSIFWKLSLLFFFKLCLNPRFEAPGGGAGPGSRACSHTRTAKGFGYMTIDS